ncbi:TM0106 family RecB-like putative nuclease [Endozoicomonas gorgoniicola]|uniref:TM0106 family RecB-like putative nuclease n=1 Tax=Endozoicomonas gorgoniicola TaxID=1234144 RepID=A0ABT3MXW8_9GAMM|nr:TM0106 family RecB-like putative nuclease [Endozoicomonas gorgoniicola]MCW7553933.1 TM0106 family RecB-like putative nuclease [Endozoicomonas gorgoniicola]
MRKCKNRIILSPSDLTRYVESPFASWMDRFALEHPDNTPAKDPVDPLMKVLQQKGLALEADIEAGFAKEGLSFQRIDTQNSEQGLELTKQALNRRVDVIGQAYLACNLGVCQFTGIADFLVKTADGQGYEVWDAKLSTKVKPAHLLQLCSYALMLRKSYGIHVKVIGVMLGNGNKESFRVYDYFAYFMKQLDRFIDDQQQFDVSCQPDPAESKNWGNWSEYAENVLTERDHLFQVATITRGQIKKLNQAGTETMQALAELNPGQRIKGIQTEVLQRLQAQAAIQKKSAGKAVPDYEILPHAPGDRKGLALLPPASSLDVFFDIEGFPLDEGGLEYLWGNTYFDDSGQRQFIDFWAHDQEQEKAAFEAFIQWVYARWQQDPTMHIYHYANYEIAACKKLMGRYGTCEYEVDQLLRNEVFVDLYKVVKGGLLIGEPRYSIKNVEHLYRPKRQTEVGTGGDSVVVYDAWRQAYLRGDEGDTWQTSTTLNSIRDYNIDDCDSTQELAQWLRERQQEQNIAYIGKTEIVEPNMADTLTERLELRDRMLQKAEQQATVDEPQSKLTANLAWMLEFHRRESKPVFWKQFERLGLEPFELEDDLDCLALCQRTERAAFPPTPNAKNMAYEYSFDPHQEFKGASKEFFLLGEETDDGKPVKVTFIRESSDLENGLVVVQSREEPPLQISLIPNEYVHAGVIEKAISQVVSEYDSGQLTSGAILDFLNRAKPNIQGNTPDNSAIAPSTDPDTKCQQIISAVTGLDNSYLPIQGPPGSGKTFTGKAVIAELVKSGAKVGISSNSHKAINNLLVKAVKECHEQGIDVVAVCSKNTGPDIEEAGIPVVKNNELIRYIDQPCIIGATAWGFARDELVNTLDYLFVDEAGQVSVASLVGMSRAAKNLVLMGDQMQLGQPTQGTHPEESGLSILDYLLHDSPTIADDMGVFLGTTFRMHSQVNEFISQSIYEGKLRHNPDNDRRVIRVPDIDSGFLDREAGIVFVPVDHEGNTQASEEEVAEIKLLAHSLIGRTFVDENGDERPIGWDDMLFVAPYNHQVRKLSDALGKAARVGSVDKFQGQEAPVVFLSMCASDASESPRGMDFLFNRNRINVAISRAQSLAVVVGNPELGNLNVNSVKQMELVNLYNALVDVCL